MKSNSTNMDTTNYGSAGEESILQNADTAKCFLPKPDTSVMTTQYTVPSDRIWNNIEKILDEQDARGQIADQIISTSFINSKTARRRKLYLALAGIGMLTRILWLLF